MGNPLRKKHNYLDDDVRLAFGSGREGEYAALSYCWGGYRGFLTERASLGDRCSCIDFDDLPQLFQDAVVVTRGLEIRYLWIDALCIIQDDKDDWDRESSRMASIYRNCKVRIAATAAKDPTDTFYPPKWLAPSVRVLHLEDAEGNSLGGSDDISDDISDDGREETEKAFPDSHKHYITDFDVHGHGLTTWREAEAPSSEDSERSADHRLSVELNSASERSGDHRLAVELSSDRQRSGDHRLSVEVGSDSESSGDYSLSVEVDSLEHRRANKYFITLPKYYAEDVDKARLNTRAWVLQERLLAPKTIHFCKDHIYTETSDDVVGEDLQSQTWGFTSCIEKSGAGPSRLIHPHDDHGRYDDQSFDTSNSWLQIVEMYSDCKITYATDKLMAIAGLAEDRRTRGGYPNRGSKYFLGMWEKTLLKDLLWTSRGPQRRKFLNQLRLPSWAWAAYESSPHIPQVERKKC